MDTLTAVKPFIPLLSLLALSSVAAQAQLISFNSDEPMTGIAVLGNSSSDVWNQYSDNTTQPDNVFTADNVLNSSGIQTSVNVTMSDFLHYVDNSAGDGALVGNLAPDLFTDYANVAFSTGAASIDFTGLSKDTAYTLVIYSRNQANVSGRDFSVSTNGVLGTAEEALNDAPNANYISTLNAGETTANGGELTFDGNYIELTALSDGNGDLDVSLNNLSGQVGNEYDINGFQLEAVATPEPGAFSMMAFGAGMLVLLAYRRRQMFSL